MILDEFRAAKEIYEEMLQERSDLPNLLNIVDKKLAHISNHIAVCHRVIAENRAAASSLTAFLPGTKAKHLQAAERACVTLDQTIQLQDQFFDFRYKVLKLLFK
jgi:hypothetical protein